MNKLLGYRILPKNGTEPNGGGEKTFERNDTKAFLGEIFILMFLKKLFQYLESIGTNGLLMNTLNRELICQLMKLLRKI